MRLVAAALIAATLAPVVPRVDDLVGAMRAGDPELVEQVARRLGARRLAPALGGGASREARQAALHGAPHVDDAWALLPELARLAGEPDRPVAAAAARAAAAIARDLADRGPHDEDAPWDVLATAASGCAEVARRRAAWADVRVHALECAAGLAVALGRDAPAEAAGLARALLADAEPEVRLAALAYVGAEEAGRAAADDPDPAVAAAAAIAACADAPDDGGAALGSAGRARVRALALDPALEPGLVAALVPCLAAGATAEDERVLATLAASGPPLVRARARRIVGEPPAVVAGREP